ncbi:YALI0D22462p [Yarrowia lipolytica CLIB122]|uniref:YALI0D22462p n=2 Tax=Yarrowia lipolytica TaxID=4952 RepID=Q6C860_YARLI|nr:YALI0D22462p [Yarrowia lipolytica CLIB122]AOW04465.1 hypothetical protein YALI1_D28537g [Yarrowia lipolytica]KAB8285723.1 hypothetical protein BKA91DRAFT_29635 [Yarrowia lipolytica]KAE8172381.1 hypothetical protein BKA90DRAFT_18598 [Yarrowia lipolytica]KAJ8054065.1 hypothetical protein LXG23DRAFT_55637 [Yarrowia lipolytica]RMI99357.1 hypothetical protein BD777DRAFT_84980 [Yarrowia lipolytica]|eukprot:XP_503152.1 YALI0D22462p [Yarrowia lipolytica CLIB122]
MLPELIERICSYLELADIVALRKTNRHYRQSISESLVRDKLMQQCPYYRLEYSQHGSWRTGGAHYVRDRHIDVFIDLVECSFHTDSPLPRDFECLCTDVERTFSWDYNNRGICFNEKQLDLSDLNTDFAVPCNYGVSFGDAGTTIKYHGFGVTVEGRMIQARHTSRAIAAISVHQGHLMLTVKYPNKAPESIKMNCKPPLRLQVIGDCVYVFGRHDHTSVLYLITPTRCSEMLHAQRRQPPAGMVLYDGNVYNVDMDGRYRCSVTRVTHRITSDRNRPPDKFHRVYQDEKHSQYCLIYKSTGLVTGIVDLKKRQKSILSQISSDIFADYNGANEPEDHLLMVGLSHGTVGCWRYTMKYLAEKYKSQHGAELPVELRAVLKQRAVSLSEDDARGRRPVTREWTTGDLFGKSWMSMSSKRESF